MPKKKWFWNESTDNLLRRNYDSSVKGRSQVIANRLKVPRWVVNRRAAALGLSRPKDRPWSVDDESYLEANLHRTSIKTLARKLARSPTAIKLKAKRLGVRKHDEGYTACSLAEALGVDPHWVLTRIRSGELRAIHRQTQRTIEQGGDSWLITDEGVVEFLRDHAYEVDLRKVDSLWFMDLVAPYLQRDSIDQRPTEAA
ncbi:MAG: hypothetical protein GEU75_17235 [Dehalococcoidia bacterium]|nr:hypothetical protein [Dehalococcoidia bacterium]